MNALAKILLESSIIMSGFYALYLLFLRNDKNFEFTRLYLIGSSFLSITLPQLRLPLLSVNSAEAPIPVLIHDAIQLPEIIIFDSLTNASSSGMGLSGSSIVLIIYLSGVSIFLAKFLYEMFSLIAFIYRNRRQIEQRSFYRLVRTGGRIPTSSFFNYLFWDETVELNPAEKEQIIRHEEGHIRQLHSYDILYLELLRIIFWFNPFVHGYRKAIASIHEYLADKHVLKDEPLQQYVGLLARQVLRSCNLSLNNHFSRSQTVNRIRMIKSNRRRPELLKWGISLAMTSVMFYIFACETGNSSHDFNTAADRFPVMEHERIIKPSEISTASYRKTVEAWITENPERSYVIISSPEPQKTLGDLSAMDDWRITSSYIDEKNGSSVLYGIVSYEPGYRRSAPNQDEIFSEVDVPPTPENGIQSFYKFISENLVYPEEAKTNGVQGKVFVEFVVNEYGAVEQVKVSKGFDPACDEAAMRVIRQSPQWVPGYKDGMAVNVKMILPISFALDSK